MNKSPERQVLVKVSFKSQAALTLIEVICIIAVLAIGIGLLLPALAKSKPHRSHINCGPNLKQVSLAFRIWEGDNNDHYPMAIYRDTNGVPLYYDSTSQFRYFQIMSNELSNPQVLICPEDKKHTSATNFTTDFNGSHISYFVGLDADEIYPQLFLAGDSNITNGLSLNHGMMEVAANRPFGWTQERHQGKGNIAMADGSVQQFDAEGLKAWIRQAGFTNHLLMPK